MAGASHILEETVRAHYRQMTPRRFALLVGLILFCFYLLLAWLVMDPETFWSPDEGAKFLQMSYLRWNGGLEHDIAYTGLSLDPELRLAPTIEGRGLLEPRGDRLVFRRLPIFPLLSLLPYRLLGAIGLVLLPALGGAIIATITPQLLEPGERHPAVWLLIALGSPILIYSTIFWEHTLATALDLLAVWLALQNLEGQTDTGRQARWRTFAIGLLLSASALLRLETVIFALAFLSAYGILAPQKWRRVIWSGGMVIGTVLLNFMFHNLLFGDPVPGNTTHLFVPFRYLSRVGWSAVQDLLVGPVADESVQLGWRGMLWTVGAIVALFVSLIRRPGARLKIMQRLALILTIIVAASFLYSHEPYRSTHGLLFSTPWVLLGLCRIPRIWRMGSRKVRIIGLTILLGLVGYVIGLLFLRGASPHGGLEWGGRFFLSFIPLLAIMAGRRLPRRFGSGHGWLGAILAAMLFLGLGFQIRGLLTINHDKQISATLNQELEEAVAAGYTLSSDLWWLPFNAAPIFVEEAIFVFDDDQSLEFWLNISSTGPISRFALVSLDQQWLDHAQAAFPGYGFSIDLALQVENLWILYFSR
jgi:hypothetical protein